MREGLLLHSGLVVTHQLLERLVQAGGGQAADHTGQDGAGIEGRASWPSLVSVTACALPLAMSTPMRVTPLAQNSRFMVLLSGRIAAVS